MDKCMLQDLYCIERLSTKEIADLSGYSVHKVDYWIKKYGIRKRSISEAVFVKNRGRDDGFKMKEHELSDTQRILYGMGLGIYWGEGNKKNKHAVRVGNTDAELIKTFIKFLIEVCGVDRKKIRYGLQIFSDTNEEEVLNYWISSLNISRSDIMPTINRIISGRIGTYTTKNQYGVMTVYVFNTKLRNWLVSKMCMPR